MTWEVRQGDCIEVMRQMDAGSVHCVVTSPPYWGLRDYGVAGQIGLEPSMDAFLAKMVDVFREVKRVLRNDGSCWVNLGDSYTVGRSCGGESPVGKTPTRVALREGLKHADVATPVKAKNLCGIPWRVAFALQADGWYLRSDIIWHKPNPMPESVTDRPTKSHEYMFLLAKKPRYYYDAEAVREGNHVVTRRAGYSEAFCRSQPDAQRHWGGKGGFADCDVTTVGRNLRDVWTIPTEAFSAAHFATFPRKLVEPCIKAGTSEKGRCPECGAGWVRVVERERFGKAPSGTKFDHTMQGGPLSGSRQAYRAAGLEGPPSPKTIGWDPGCGCFDGIDTSVADRSPVPCKVADIFMGSGTTGVVATQLGRDFLGIELNPDYCEMASKRIANPEPEPELVDVPGQDMFEFAEAPNEQA